MSTVVIEMQLLRTKRRCCAELRTTAAADDCWVAPRARQSRSSTAMAAITRTNAYVPERQPGEDALASSQHRTLYLRFSPQNTGSFTPFQALPKVSCAETTALFSAGELRRRIAGNAVFELLSRSIQGSLTDRSLAERYLTVAATVRTWQQARSCARLPERPYTSP